jgi:hypothetical protein
VWEIGLVALVPVTIAVWMALNAPSAVAASKRGDEHG